MNEKVHVITCSLFQVGFKIKQIMKDEDFYKDRDSQIAAIEKTFEKAKVEVGIEHSVTLNYLYDDHLKG